MASSDAQPAHGLVSVRQLPGAGVFEVRVHLGASPNAPRRQSVCAHEIGHLFCWVAWEVLANCGHGTWPPSGDEQEIWCWDFAAEFACPMRESLSWTADMMRALVDDLDKGHDPRHVTLTLGRLYALARRYQLSARNLMRVLHRMPVLSELRECIALMEVAPNRATGTQPALRTIKTALPDGLFLPTNRRARRQGFSNAERIHDSGKDLSYIEVDEEVIMTTRNDKTQRWSTEPLPFACKCVYVPVTWEGRRYVVVTWRYSMPQATHEGGI